MWGPTSKFHHMGAKISTCALGETQTFGPCTAHGTSIGKLYSRGPKLPLKAYCGFSGPCGLIFQEAVTSPSTQSLLLSATYSGQLAQSEGPSVTYHSSSSCPRLWVALSTHSSSPPLQTFSSCWWHQISLVLFSFRSTAEARLWSSQAS